MAAIAVDQLMLPAKHVVKWFVIIATYQIVGGKVTARKETLVECFSRPSARQQQQAWGVVAYRLAMPEPKKAVTTAIKD
jgi:hypothetical protein